MTASGRRYYPGLSGLRAIAALTVLFTHVERWRVAYGMNTLLSMPFNSFIGSTAVTFFFVLSGFLITLLLLKEKATEGTIRVKRFFTNRALRIWPLYYAVLVVGYLVAIFVIHDWTARGRKGMLLDLLLLPNISFALGVLPDMIVQIWSIGTEEQFYFAWPFLVKRFSPAQLARIFIALIVLWALARLPFQLLIIHSDVIDALLYRTRIDCMAIGGFAALLLFQVERSAGWWTTLHRRLMHPLTGWAVAVLFVFMVLVSWRLDISFYQLYALLFAVICLRVTGLPVRWLEFAPLRYMGKISYGIYMLHQFVIFVLIREWETRHPIGEIGNFLVTALLTTGLAALSYTFFESFFLRRQLRRPAPAPGPALS